MSQDKDSDTAVWPNGPVLEIGRLKAMPDGVAIPVENFDPAAVLGDPVNRWHLKSITFDQANALFDFLHGRDIFLTCAEAKMIRPEGNYSVFEYNILPGDPIKEFGSERVAERMKSELFRIWRLAQYNEDFPIIYDVWLDEIER